jgi:hypothetical protein
MEILCFRNPQGRPWRRAFTGLAVAAVGFGVLLGACDGGNSATTTTTGADAAAEAAADVTSDVDAGVTCASGQMVCGASCTDTSKDPANCGTCGNACGTALVCSAGKCTTSCGPASTACGGSCTNTQSDNANCGSCGNACAEGDVCSQGACATSCGGGTTQCGSSCADTKVDPTNCGACGKACAAGSACVAGSCKTQCAPNEKVCTTDGGAYCANTDDDNLNCGGCGVACPHGQVCSGGACSTSCQSNETLCGSDGGADASSPYCANTRTDQANCGACGNACPAGQVCSAGQCSTSCQPNETLCGSDGGADAASPYCANTQTDQANCGGCGNACPAGQACSAGQCATTCQPNETQCSPDGGASYCANTSTDGQNCGTCGNACPAGQVCSKGGCSTVCATGLAVCGNQCIDLQSDRDHCGSCSGACAAGQTCSSGQCCSVGYSFCSGACIDTYDDSNNCGGCGVTCSGSTPVCAGGTCAATCPNGYTVNGGRCARTFTITWDQVIGAAGSNACGGSGTVQEEYGYNYYENCNGSVYLSATSQFFFQWSDTGPADGLNQVTRIDVTWGTGGYSTYISENNGSDTESSFTETLALDGNTVGTVQDGSNLTCSAMAPTKATSIAGGAGLSGYILGGANQFSIQRPSAPTCTPSPSNSCCVDEYISDLGVNAAWGTGAVAQVTVTY